MNQLTNSGPSGGYVIVGGDDEQPRRLAFLEPPHFNTTHFIVNPLEVWNNINIYTLKIVNVFMKKNS